MSISIKDAQTILTIFGNSVECVLKKIKFNPLVKEPGHSYGEKFEEEIVDMLSKSHPQIFSVPTKVIGKGRQTRNLEDCFVLEKPTNIKFGYQKQSQPNICSFERLLKKYHTNEIDSYYILMANILDHNYTHNCYFFNVYDYLDCVHYDYGTGQVMLKETQFFNKYDINRAPASKKSAMLALEKLNENSFKKHIELKNLQYKKRKSIFNEYKSDIQ